MDDRAQDGSGRESDPGRAAREKMFTRRFLLGTAASASAFVAVPRLANASIVGVHGDMPHGDAPYVDNGLPPSIPVHADMPHYDVRHIDDVLTNAVGTQ